MVRLRGAIALSVLFTVLGSAGSADALPRGAKLTTVGLGAIKIGMTERQVERAGHRRITRRGGAGTRECTTAVLGDKVYGLFTGNLLARIYVGSRRYATRAGIRVGATEAEVFAAYPNQIRSVPHEYDPDGHYLEYRAGNRKVVFETNGQRVEQISAGRIPEIDYVEGCA